MAYDPKRPRPRADADEPAPVEALLDDVAPEPDVAQSDDSLADVAPAAAPEADPAPEVETVAEPAARVAEPEPAEPESAAVDAEEEAVVPGSEGDAASSTEEPPVLGRAVPGASSNGSGARPAPDVPVAPAPEEGTTNRAVLAAALGGVVLALLAWILWRRRHSDGG